MEEEEEEEKQVVLLCNCCTQEAEGQVLNLYVAWTMHNKPCLTKQILVFNVFHYEESLIFCLQLA